MRGFSSLLNVSVDSIVEESNIESQDAALDSNNTTVVFTLNCTYNVVEPELPVMNYSETTETGEAAETTGTETAVE